MISRVETGRSRVVFGPGSCGELSAQIDDLGCGRAFLIAGGGLDPPGGVPLVGRTEAGGPVPTAERVAAGRARVEACNADAVLAVGGPAIGLAKAIALRGGPPIVAVPTTYGGAEMMPGWSIVEDAGPVSGIDWSVLPRLVVYDPQLQLGLSPRESAASAINALANAVEALWSPASNPVSSALAEDAIRVLATGIGRLVAVPDDQVIRTALLRGAWLAGAALAGARASIHHRLCELLGAAFELPRGELHAVVLPYVAAFEAPVVPGAMTRIARALRCEDPIAGIGRLIRELRLPHTLADLGLRPDQLGKAVELMVAADLESPRPLTDGDCRALLQRAFQGRVR